MFGEPRIVDNRVFLLGLDHLYRVAMKYEERGELLICARRVTSALHITPAEVPVEGYYIEDEQLTEYFRLVRALQDTGDNRRPEAASLPEFQRLLSITSSPLYGRPIAGDRLLPVGRDALSQALLDTRPEWSVQRLIETACARAQEMDDFSLVGLAARTRDAVVLAATRESVVLYSENVIGAVCPPRQPKYIWKVDKELARQARRFIETFNGLFGETLPPPEPAYAGFYGDAYKAKNITGRCVRLGYNDAVSPVLQYHWAICRGNEGSLMVQEFWHPEVWTTERYRSALGYDERCPEL